MQAGVGLEGRRIVVLRNDRIGDLVLALPLVQALKDSGAYVGVLTSPACVGLLEGDPRVDALVVDGPDAARELAARGFDTALVAWAHWRNARLAWTAGIGQRLGPSMRPYSRLFTRRLPLRRGRGWVHESDLNLEFGRALGWTGATPWPRLFLPSGAKVRARAWLKAKVPQGGGPLVLLHPGSGGSAQPWAPERFVGLGHELKRRNRARLVVTAGPMDRDAADACLAGLKDGAVSCDGLDLAAFGALLGQADLFVAGSTGPLHMAAAQGTPVLGLYPALRAMSPLRWGPRGSPRAVLSPAGLGFRIPARDGLNTLERVSVDEAVQVCQFLLRRRLKR